MVTTSIPSLVMSKAPPCQPWSVDFGQRSLQVVQHRTGFEPTKTPEGAYTLGLVVQVKIAVVDNAVATRLRLFVVVVVVVVVFGCHAKDATCIITSFTAIYRQV